MQKRVIRIIMGCGNRDFYRIEFKQLKLLPLMSKNMLSLLTLVVNKDQCLVNSDIHNINIKNSANLHLPWTNLDIYQTEYTTQVLKFLIVFLLTLCRSNLNLYYLGRKAAFFSVGI
jgi:hypothetical protein